MLQWVTRNKAVHEWRYKDSKGKEGQVNLHGTFKSNTGEMMCEAAVQGVGIVILPVFYVAEHLRTGALQQILSNSTTWPSRDIHAVFLPNRYLSTRLRLFVDHLTLACKTLPWEGEGGYQ